MKLCLRHYTHKSISDAKFESGSTSSFFGDMKSQNFPRKKGTSHQIRLFAPRKGDLTEKIPLFMSRIVLPDPKLTPMSISAISKQGKIFRFVKFWDAWMRNEQQQPPDRSILLKFGQNMSLG